MHLIQLETGIRNHAALRLYRGSGYHDRGPFGDYPDNGVSVFLEKTLWSNSLRARCGSTASEFAMLAWCVMPIMSTHLIETRAGNALDNVVHSWKSLHGACGQPLARTRNGRFWAPEYFDRLRNDAQLVVTQAYIEENPVNAGLCADASAWPYSSASCR